MYTLRLSLLAVLCVSAVNAGDTGYALDQGFNFLVRNSAGSAAVVHYVTKKAAIVYRMHPVLERYKVDVAVGHVAHNVVKRAIDKNDTRDQAAIALDAGKDAVISLAVTNFILPVLERVADKTGIACIFDVGAGYYCEYPAVKATAYGVTHGVCRFGLDALIALAKAQAKSNS